MDTELLKNEYEKYINSKNNEFLIFYSSFLDLITFLSKIVKESKGQTVLICDTVSKANQVFKIIKKYINVSEISIINKNLSKTEIFSSYKKISTSVHLVIGTKTAIFAPFYNLENIVVIDEESLYHKQYDQNPRYNVKEVSSFLKDQNKNIKLIYTSTCPSLDTYSKNLKILNIENKNENINLHFLENTSSVISEILKEKIYEALEKNKKTIIINNNKLFSSSIICSDCGYIEKCDICKVAMKLDKKDNKEICNICSIEKDLITNCPKCNGINIKFNGIGNQKIEQEINKIFPDKKILIVDKEKIININELNKADIIIGTEFLVQNYLYYISNIYSLVLFSIDNYFQIPDYKSNEILYRYIKKFIDIYKEKNIENLMIKTRYQDNNILNLAINNEYNKFYNYELSIRKALNYPPFSIIIKIIIKDKLEKEFNKKYLAVKDILSTTKKFETIGENKVKDKFEVHFIIKIKKEDYDNTKEFLKKISENALLDISPEFLIK